MKIARMELTLMLSKLLGLVGVDDTFHGHRVGYMVWCFSEPMGLMEDHRIGLLEAGLLHDIGVSSTLVHKMLTEQIDVPDAIRHCVVGEAIIGATTSYAQLAPLVRYHHDHWIQFDFDEVDPTIALYSNLIFLADRLDVLVAQYQPVNAEQQQAVLDKLLQLKGLMFAPQAIENMLSATENSSFWERLQQPEQLAGYLLAQSSEDSERVIHLCRMEEIATSFSHVVDAKSPFTSQHSQLTSEVAELLGSKAGLTREATNKIRMAGMLHDVGKLRVPDEILEKPGKLDAQERMAIERHPQDSWEILREVEGLREVAEWIWMHHEKLNGSGYPRGLQQAQIPQEAQVLAVADIFQSLMQLRPYRPPMEIGKVFQIMDTMVRDGEINGELVGLIKQHQQEFIERASA